MILVTGATGHLGRLVLSHLVKKVPAAQVIAGVRTPSKAKELEALGVQVRELDYNRPATVDAALKGVEKVLLISSSEFGNRAGQHQVVIDAAKKAGVKLLAYTGILHSDNSKLALAADHQTTEKALRASGVPFVALRNGWYHENYTGNLATTLQHGAMLGAAGEGKVAPAARVDFAEAAVAVLTTPGHEGKAYELAGDRAYTLSELAAEVEAVKAEVAQAIAGGGDCPSEERPSTNAWVESIQTGGVAPNCSVTVRLSSSSDIPFAARIERIEWNWDGNAWGCASSMDASYIPWPCN